MTTELDTIPEVSGIEKAIAQPIIDAFMPHFQTAISLAEKAKAINVTDPTDLDGIAAARALRLELRKARIASDKVRADRKAVYLKMGQAIQGVHNRILAIAEPEEKRLQDMEDIAARMQAERKAKLCKERVAALMPFNPPNEPTGDAWMCGVENMTEAAFQALLAGMKAAHEKRIADAQAAEEARLKAEFERAEREEEMRLENARLKAEAEAKAAAAEEERKRVEAERKRVEEERRLEREAAEAKQRAIEEEARKQREAVEAKARAEREAQQKAIEEERKARQAEREEMERKQAEERRKAEEKAAQERAAAAAIARKEREAREAAERELAEKRRQEEARLEADQKAKEDAAKAPDKKKLLAYADALMALEPSPMVTVPGNVVARKIERARVDLVNWIREQAKGL